MTTANMPVHSDFSILPQGLDVAPMVPQPGEFIAIAEREEYCYYVYYLQENQTVAIPHLNCASVFLPSIDNQLTEITVNRKPVPAGGSALSEATELIIKATKGSGYVLVAGSKLSVNSSPQIVIHQADEHYVVRKPWGHELWINGEHPVFSFKEVYIKEGAQTSLQYHRFKKEAALLYKGTCDIVYKKNSLVSNDNVNAQDLAAARLTTKGKICVEPPTLHRMKAVTDMYHYEVSTPHLDDVIRVQDDNKRGHGRILEEHLTA